MRASNTLSGLLRVRPTTRAISGKVWVRVGLRGGAAVRARRSCASNGRRLSSDILLRTVSNGTRSIEVYRKVCHPMFASENADRTEKGATGDLL